MPFHSLRDVKLEQPIFGANYLHGKVIADPGGNWNGEADILGISAGYGSIDADDLAI